MTEEQLLALVAGRLGGSWERAEPLEGGYVNWVWRVYGSRGRVIVKVAPPFVASRPSVPLSPRRLRYEALCLNHFGGRGDGVTPPKLLAYVESAGAVIMEDCGSCPSLEAALRVG